MTKRLSWGEPVPRNVLIHAGVPLPGDLAVPGGARGVVVFAHGSGSGRHSSRNRFVARYLREVSIGTLLIDMLSGDEAASSVSMERLAERLGLVSEWLAADVETRELPVGYFGASTGAAVALRAAAKNPERVAAVVCRGGRPDLVEPAELHKVECPTLLLVGSLDSDVLALNRRAFGHLRGERQLEIVEGASHLFEEPGALETVAHHTCNWFLTHMSPSSLSKRYVHGAASSHANQREDALGVYELSGDMLFTDRAHAGRLLARELERYRDQAVLVLGVPRGGVPVAFEVAQHLRADLDVIVARKLGAPGQEELAIGAVTADGTRFLNQEIIDALGVSDNYVQRVTAEQGAEARRRERRFRRGLPGPVLAERTVIIVDDGLATGATLRAAARALRHEHVRELVVAVPVGSRTACDALREEVDQVVCTHMPEPFFAVGAHYVSFPQTSDEEVEELLARYRRTRRQRPASEPRRALD